MEPHQIASGDRREVNLLDYWRIIWAGKWTIAAIFVVVASTVAVSTYLQTPVYRATANVEVSARGKSIAPGSDFSQLGAGWGFLAAERYQKTQIEIIKSRDIAHQVMDDLGLAQDPAFAGAKDPTGKLRGMVDAEAIEDTNIIKISMEGTAPATLQRLVNGVAHAYVQRNVTTAVEATSSTLNELLRQVQPIRSKIRAKEKELLGMARSSGLYVPESQAASMGQSISQLQKELTGVQIQRGKLEAVFKEISRIEKSGGDFQTLPQVAADVAIQDMNTQANSLEKDLERLSVTYLDKHPKVVEKRTELEEVRRKITAQVNTIISRIKTEYSMALQGEKSLEVNLKRAKEQSLDVTVASTDYKILKAEIDEDRRIYNLILTRIKEIDLNQDTLNNNLRVLDEAILPGKPVRPRKLLNILAGCMLGLMLGVGTVVFMDYVDNTVKTAEDIEHDLNLHILAVVPRARKASQASVKEAFQTLRTSLLFSSQARGLNTLLVTSAGPGEGKTSTTVALARNLAAAGDRVILLDADLRRPTVHAKLGLERSGGLTNYLLSTEKGQAWLGYVKDVPEAPNLKVITCGPIPPNPPELFSTEKFRDLILELRKSFDWVLVDSPPLISLSDSLVLASLSDMVAVVIKHNENDRDLIRRAVSQLRKVKANVIGAVLNDVDLARTGYKNYYYAGYYYYGREQELETGEAPVKVTAGKSA